MTDRIRISRIGVFAFHGMHAEEQRLGQRFFISVDCHLDLAKAGATDDLTRSVDYSALTERVQEIAVTQTFRTIEALAEVVAQTSLLENALIDAITVTVEKPGAAIPAILDGVSVEITRKRADV